MCINCASGLHWECIQITDSKCCCNGKPVDSEIENENDDKDDKVRSRFRRGKRDATLKDQQSTGRKRAAVEYPLDLEAPCEWRRLRFAGGGQYPIIGCNNGLQKARHHGPDKNTLNNDKGNVHRICHHCHNRWHAVNDPVYDPNSPTFRPHDPVTQATMDEIIDNELYYADNRPKHIKGA